MQRKMSKFASLYTFFGFSLSFFNSIIFSQGSMSIQILWFAKPELFPPQKECASKIMHDALHLFECRQGKLSCTGKFLVDICFQYGDGAVIRENLILDSSLSC